MIDSLGGFEDTCCSTSADPPLVVHFIVVIDRMLLMDKIDEGATGSRWS